MQNFQYGPEDWYVLTKPGPIIAISENNFDIYFASRNGVFRYNKSLEDFNYESAFSMELDLLDIRHFYYDTYRDYFWIVYIKLVRKDRIINKSNISDSSFFDYYTIKLMNNIKNTIQQ